MCAIAGLFMADGAPVDPAELRAMAAAQAHRGPDGQGTHVDGSLGLAHCRLAILDLTAAGRQPMCNEDETVWVVYNGQLFDFADKRAWLESRGHRFRSRTDTEILVHLYEERGDDLVHEIEGMFAFAIWDARRRRLLLARDRLGIKPLYYTESDGGVAFASELRALLTLSWLRQEQDLEAAIQFLYQSTVPGDRCLIRGVHKVQPAEVVVVEGGRVRRRTYWRPPPADDAEAVSLEAAAEQLQRHLATVVRSHLVADVPVGTFLSGGLDSAAVTAEARRALQGPLHTFSARFGDRQLDEGPAAAESAAALGTVHHELILDDSHASVIPRLLGGADEPFAVASAVALHHLARFARSHVKVVLTGDGADEILAGYPWRHEPETGRGAGAVSFLRGIALTGVRSVRSRKGGGPALAAQLTSRLTRMSRPDERYAEIASAFTPEELEAVLAPDMRGRAWEAWEAHPIRAAYRNEATADEVNRRLRVDLRTTLVDEMLTKVDRMTMAAGLEARVPFLERRFVEWSLRLPGRHKVAHGVGKRVLREALAPVLPRAALRPKRGFNVPLGAWIRGPLRELVRDVLAPAAVKRRGLLNPEAISRLVDAHLEGRGDHARKVYTLLALEMWRAGR